MNRKGFTLIELMIVIAIIAIIAAIAIPGILAARRSANANAAMGNLKSFSTAMTVYQQKNAAQTYPPANANKGPDLTTDTDNTYSHLSPKGGYIYEYYVDTVYSKYCYVAYPTSLNNGTKMFVVDESNSIWEATITATATATTCSWATATAQGPDRITFTNAAVTGSWIKKS